MTDIKQPELPEPDLRVECAQNFVDGWTAEKMRAHYAKGREDERAEAAKQWRCFHCDEVFTDEKEAALHFGLGEFAKPGCILKVETEERSMLYALRQFEAEHERYCREDTDLHRAMYSMQGNYEKRLIHEEEKGYARGLKDAGYEIHSNNVQQLEDELAALKQSLAQPANQGNKAKCRAFIETLLKASSICRKEGHEGDAETLHEIAEFFEVDPFAQPAQGKIEDRLDETGYAARLTLAIYEKHYKQHAPEFKLNDTLHGLLLQIDNMVSGLARKSQQPAQAAAQDVCHSCGANYHDWEKNPYAAQAAVPEGWKLVPIEPTETMVNEAVAQCVAMHPYASSDAWVKAGYSAMLNAAPEREGGAC